MLERTVRLALIATLLWLPSAWAEIAIKSARIWPAQDYTRLTLESKEAIRYLMRALEYADAAFAAALAFVTGKGFRPAVSASIMSRWRSE